jgi:tetratricopeptide (TPR) repeat protein
MKIKCPLCGLENEERSKFCKNCNEPLFKQEYSEDNPYIKKRGNKDQPFELILDEEVRAETKGRKYKRLNLEYGKLLEKPDSNFGLIKKYRKELSKIENILVNRNLKGIKLEKEGKIDKAIKLYEKNIEEEFEGSHPYTRLAIIYSKKGLLDDEIRVLKKAIWVFENIVYKERGDRSQKPDKFMKRLEKANKKRLQKKL